MKKKDKICNCCNYYEPSYNIPTEDRVTNSDGQTLGQCKITGKNKHPQASCGRWKRMKTAFDFEN